VAEVKVLVPGEGKLKVADLVEVARHPSVRVELAREAEKRIKATAKKVADLVESYRKTPKDENLREYGVTTGFGEFKNKSIPYKKLFDLQRNLLLSHSVGVGENTNPEDFANYYSAEVIRATLLVRLNAFVQGNSGIRLELANVLRAMLNGGIIPLVPLRGSVGASGDLCPLSHLFATLLGEGEFYLVEDAKRTRIPASELLPELRKADPKLTKEHLRLHPKEGLALNNGANFSAAMLALGAYDAHVLADTADVAVAMTVEAIGGCSRAFHEWVHNARPHPGQKRSAERVRALLRGSKFLNKSNEVQDPYSVRCAPQVHGASREAIQYAMRVAEREINSATDNPLFFAQSPNDGVPKVSFSAGNFHGEPLALAADFLTIAVAELANISERRTQMLLDGNHNRNLPENLIPYPGLNSGFMIAQYTAASLVSENKVLSHPASVDSIPTSANSEDHVSMSTHAARKMRTVLGNAQSVLAIELLVAAQALEWRAVMAVPSSKVKDREKKAYRPEAMNALRTQAIRFEAGVKNRNAIAKQLAKNLGPIYQTVRKQADTMLKDDRLDKDIRDVRKAIEDETLRGPSVGDGNIA